MKGKRTVPPMGIKDIRKRLANFACSTNELRKDLKIQEFIVFVSEIRDLVEEYKMHYPESAKIVLKPEEAHRQFEELFVGYIQGNMWKIIDKWSNEEIFSVASYISDKIGDFSRWFNIACLTCKGKGVYVGCHTEQICPSCKGTGLMSDMFKSK